MKLPKIFTESVPKGKLEAVAFCTQPERVKRKIAPMKPPIPTERNRPIPITF